MKVKYNAANIGDLLKHSWLIEVTEFLSKHLSSKLFKYADTFCGFKEYEIEGFFKERLINQFQQTKLYGSRKTIWKETGTWVVSELSRSY